MTQPTVPERVISPARWRQLEPLLDRALDLDPAARAVFLNDLSIASMELRTDIEWFLDQQGGEGAVRRVVESRDGRVGSSDADAPVRAGYIGRRIGPFLLTERIGTGGMGAVYRGERVDGGFRQTVAIKLILGSHHEVLERFGRERQILADLRHPHIAQLLDGGETSDGMPYFAMEFVNGRSLTEYADAVDADIDDRIRLLLQVADALAYAHQQQVLHRDIKPSNIMVGDNGQLKLLDFGIARLLANTDQTSLTIDQTGPMTPDYAAPEQFSGEALGVATDIYQFGTLMFRLLSGRMPLQASGSGSFAWARAVAEQSPISLSRAIREARRGNGLVRPPASRFRLRRAGDLDRVCHRMLAKRPSERYPDMSAVALDLTAYLENRPVSSSPLSFMFRRLNGRWVALLFAAALAAWFGVHGGIPWTDSDQRAWATSPALTAFGLRLENLHTSNGETETLLRRALLNDGAGDRPGALALLESAHENDASTPIPAMFLGYWGRASGVVGKSEQWFALAEQRIATIEDPIVGLLVKFFKADSEGDAGLALRYSAAVLQLRPDAWFLRLARAHHLGARGLREAATHELAQIEVVSLEHRKQVDAIADRASYGDLAGAREQFVRLAPQPEDPKYLDLQARLAYSGGDLNAARDVYLAVVDRSRKQARFDLEGRALLYSGILSGALGEYSKAAEQLKQAQLRLGDRDQYIYATDAALALAQIAALDGDAVALDRELKAAARLAENSGNELAGLFVALFASRLQGIDGSANFKTPAAEPARLLLQAHRQKRSGDVAAAKLSLRAARAEGAYEGIFAEEAYWLARQLEEPLPPLGPIDPPFAPYARFVCRWALGLGASVAPAAGAEAERTVTPGPD